MNQGKQSKIQAVERTFSIVEKLLELDGATCVDVSSQLELPVSTVFDHLDTLVTLGYVVHDDGEFQISSRFLDIGVQMQNQQEVYNISEQELRKLSEEVGEHAVLMTEENGYGVFLDIARSESSVQIIAQTGTRTWLHTTASGKVLLAYTGCDEVEEIIESRGLPERTDNTITDRENLFEELETIREQEYAVDNGEGLEGLNGIAVPIIDRSVEDIAASIGIYSPDNQNVDQFIQDSLSELKRTANTVEINLTYGS